MSISALGSTQPPTQWILGALSLRLKQPEHEADHSPPSSAEINNAWNFAYMVQCLGTGKLIPLSVYIYIV